MTSKKPLVNRKYKLEKFPGKGGWTYIVLEENLKAYKARFGSVRVKGTIDGFPLKNYNLAPIKGGQLFLPVRAEIRKKIGKQAGDYVMVLLYRDNEPLEIPTELMLYFVEDPDLHEAFLSYSEGQQKMFIDWINAAKRTETKIERIAKSLNRIANGQKFYDPVNQKN